MGVRRDVRLCHRLCGPGRRSWKLDLMRDNLGAQRMSPDAGRSPEPLPGS